jgi:hypothetical protein
MLTPIAGKKHAKETAAKKPAARQRKSAKSRTAKCAEVHGRYFLAPPEQPDAGIIRGLGWPACDRRSLRWDGLEDCFDLASITGH